MKPLKHTLCSQFPWCYPYHLSNFIFCLEKKCYSLSINLVIALFYFFKIAACIDTLLWICLFLIGIKQLDSFHFFIVVDHVHQYIWEMNFLIHIFSCFTFTTLIDLSYFFLSNLLISCLIIDSAQYQCGIIGCWMSSHVNFFWQHKPWSSIFLEIFS